MKLVHMSLLGGWLAFAQTTLQFPYELGEHLALTTTQIETIVANDQAFNSRQAARQGKVHGLIAGIEEAANAEAIGSRYIEIEMVRREMMSDVAEVRRKNRSLMTGAQLEKLARIETARDSSDVTYLLADAGLLPVSAGRRPNPVALLLKLYLSLTDDQVLAIERVSGQEVWRLDEGSRRAEALRRQIDFETRVPRPSVAVLGGYHYEYRAITREVYEISARFRDQRRSLLTPAQEARVKALQETAPLLHLVAPAECEGLINRISVYRSREEAPGQPTILPLNCAFSAENSL